jgi:hypothetical protein
MTKITQEEDEDKECKEEITCPGTQGGKGEEEVAEDAATKQGKQIEQGFCGRKLAANLVDSGNGKHQKYPDGAEEQAQDKREVEGVERGVIVIEYPRLRHIMLDACIEKGGSCEGDEQVGGVGREDVAKEEDMGFPWAEYLIEQGKQGDGEENAEKPQVPNAEEVNEARNGVVGHNVSDEVPLVRPSHRVLVASQLHPDAVHGVLGNDERFSHHKGVAIIDMQLLAERVNRQVMKRLTALQGKTVST